MVSKVTITVRPMGERPIKVKVASNAKVKDILKAADMDIDPEEVKFVANGTFVTVNKTLGQHRELIIIPEVRGG